MNAQINFQQPIQSFLGTVAGKSENIVVENLPESDSDFEIIKKESTESDLQVGWEMVIRCHLSHTYTLMYILHVIVHHVGVFLCKLAC